MVVFPVFVSLFIKHQFIGADPLYIGRREACRQIHPSLGISSISLINIWPYATTIIKSGSISFNLLIITESVLIFSGWKIGISLDSPTSFIGEIDTFLPLPLGLSGYVTMALTLYFSIIFFNEGTEKSGVPIKTIFIIATSLLYPKIYFIVIYYLHNILQLFIYLSI